MIQVPTQNLLGILENCMVCIIACMGRLPEHVLCIISNGAIHTKDLKGKDILLSSGADETLVDTREVHLPARLEFVTSSLSLLSSFARNHFDLRESAHRQLVSPSVSHIIMLQKDIHSTHPSITRPRQSRSLVKVGHDIWRLDRSHLAYAALRSVPHAA
jgi:hypothetical protein